MHAKLKVQTRDPCNLLRPLQSGEQKSRHFLAENLLHPIASSLLRAHLAAFHSPCLCLPRQSLTLDGQRNLLTQCAEEGSIFFFGSKLGQLNFLQPFVIMSTTVGDAGAKPAAASTAAKPLGMRKNGMCSPMTPTA